MLMLTPLILFAAQLSATLANAYDNITPEVAAERVTGCGAGKVTVRSDAAFETDVLVVAGDGPISDTQLFCMDKAASFYDVELTPKVQLRFNAIREARSAALMAAEAQKWLKSHNLLDRLPKYEKGVTDETAFAREVEKLCGADRALQSQYGVHALNPEWAAQHSTYQPDNGPFACLLNVTWATGFKMGFIGNERAKR